MIVTKPGNKKYVTVSNVTIYEGTCNDCGAQFEIQEGELYLLRGPELNRPMTCPYCRKCHTDYIIKKLRTDIMPVGRVINPSEEDERYTVREDQVEDWGVY